MVKIQGTLCISGLINLRKCKSVIAHYAQLPPTAPFSSFCICWLNMERARCWRRFANSPWVVRTDLFSFVPAFWRSPASNWLSLALRRSGKFWL